MAGEYGIPQNFDELAKASMLQLAGIIGDSEFPDSLVHPEVLSKLIGDNLEGSTYVRIKVQPATYMEVGTYAVDLASQEITTLDRDTADQVLANEASNARLQTLPSTAVVQQLVTQRYLTTDLPSMDVARAQTSMLLAYPSVDHLKARNSVVYFGMQRFGTSVPGILTYEAASDTWLMSKAAEASATPSGELDAFDADVELDRFRKIFDVLGHAAIVDELLKAA
jgi:hypothetical protein